MTHGRQRRSGHQHSTTANPTWFVCPECGKRSYESRRAAKGVAKRLGAMNGQTRNSSYECLDEANPDGGSGRWHIGRLAPAVVYGLADRRNLYRGTEYGQMAA